MLGNLKLQNNTLFTNQDYAIYSVYSVLSSNGLQLIDNAINGKMILVSESTVNLINIIGSSITTINDGATFMSISYSAFSLSNIVYQNSNASFFEALSSHGDITGIEAQNVKGHFFMNIRSSNLNTFSNLNANMIAVEAQYTVNIAYSKIKSISNHTYSQVKQIAMELLYSQIDTIENFIVSNSSTGLNLEYSSVLNFTNSHLSDSGTLDSLKSSGIHSLMSNLTIHNSTFERLKAQTGAALYVDCIAPSV